MKATPVSPGILPLRAGDRLTQPEFHARYEQYPDHIKFELIGGGVYMASPLSDFHAHGHLLLGMVFGVYEAATSGVRGVDNVTTILGEHSEPQPDLSLRILPECGGQSCVNEDGYLAGPPELLAEVSYSREAVDLGPRHDDYQQAGVGEYIVVCLQEQAIHWFDFRRGTEIRPTRQGVYRSRLFPGLWVNGPALLAGDAASLLATLQEGVASAPHAAFVRRLERARQRRRQGP